MSGTTRPGDESARAEQLRALIRDVPDLFGDVRQAMPKGRNFH